MTVRQRNYSEEEFAELVRRRDRDAIERVRSTAATGRDVMDSTQSHDRIARPGASASASSPYRSKSSTARQELAVLSPKFRSKLETAFAGYLDMQRRAGIFRDIWYEPLNLRLPGQKNFYKPDFFVLEAAGGIILYEVKGYSPSNERSLVKLKTAAGLHTWARFVLVKRIKGHWEERVMT
jgi:hypothetical protein